MADGDSKLIIFPKGIKMAVRNLKYVPLYLVVEIGIRDFADAFGHELFSDLYFPSQV